MAATQTTESACPVCGREYSSLMVHVNKSHPGKKERLLLDELERLADELGRTPHREEMADVGKFGSSTYRRQFGSWNEALEAADLNLNKPCNVSDERLLEELKRLAAEYGRTPTVDLMIEVGEYSGGAYQGRFGSWNEALREAGLPINLRYRVDEPSVERKRALKKWAKVVKRRDGYTCKDCGDDSGGNLQSHHIKRRADCEINDDGVDEALALWNGVCLCTQCHRNRHIKAGEMGAARLIEYKMGKYSYRKAARRESKTSTPI